MAVWTATALVAPPIPADATRAVALAAVASIVAVPLAGRVGATRAALAALVAGFTAALGTNAVVAVLADHGPARLIPGIVTEAPTPADNLLNSRVELGDPYVLAQQSTVDSQVAGRTRFYTYSRATRHV